MSIGDFFSVVSDVPTLLKLKRGMKSQPLGTKDCFARRVEQNAINFADDTAVICEGKRISWSELNRLANRYAHTLQKSNIHRGDVVSVFMENRIAFLAMVIALNKLGAVAALVNTNLRGNHLLHCISVISSKLCIFGTELTEAMNGVRSGTGLHEGSDFFAIKDKEQDEIPSWSGDLSAESVDEPDDNLNMTSEVILGDTAMYIFTSGTTGLPKAALVSNRRYLQIATLSHVAGLRCSKRDCIYICLPLYHGTGLMVGCGAAFSSGAAMFIRRQFSVSQFLPEVREHAATCLIYVGELLRYLMSSEEEHDDSHTTLTTAMGNGLRPDIWDQFKKRFGVDRVTEFYGASEGNVAFANILNKNQTIGVTASKVALIRYDVSNNAMIRNSEDRCIEVEPGEPGLCIGHINPDALFEGYTDAQATEKKILRNVFQDGDAWFNTGDLLRTVDVGFSLGYPHYQFVDRIGDTFRWRSENVSTNEVAESINGFEGIKITNVFGVEIPNTEGRAGMAAIVLNEGIEGLDMAKFSEFVGTTLSPFARPVFVRIQAELDVTGTFKLVKGNLQKEGYDINVVPDPIYIMKSGSTQYELLELGFYEAIVSGKGGF